jgi:hypothetical protein
LVLHLVSVPEKEFNLPFYWTINDITINSIVTVEYHFRPDGGTSDWQAATPSGGEGEGGAALLLSLGASVAGAFAGGSCGV